MSWGKWMRRNSQRRSFRSRTEGRRLRNERLEPRLVLDSTVVFSELYYHPVENNELEWVELHNQMAVDMDLSGWRIDGGVTYDFPEGTVVPGGGYVVVAKNPTALAGAGVADAMGPFVGSLSNAGEELVLYNSFHSFQTRDGGAAALVSPFADQLAGRRRMDVVTYGDSGEWPVGPDGSGASLAKLEPNSSSESPANWTTSEQLGGTPGAVNFPPNITERFVQDFVAVGSTATVHVPTDNAIGTDWINRDYVEGSRGEAWSAETTGVGFFNGEAGTPYEQVVLADNPLTYWRFSETDSQNGATNLGTLGDDVDGVFSAEAMVGTDSLVGQATDRSLAASAEDDAAPFMSSEFDKVGAGRTIEFWFSIDSMPTKTVNLVGDAKSFLDYGMRVQLKASGNLIVYHKTSSNFIGSFYDSERAIAAGEVVHVVATWDSVTGESHLFLDGVEATRINQRGPSPDTGVPQNTTNPIFVGRDGQGLTSGLIRIDEVSIYDYALAANRVAVHYDAGRPTFDGLFETELNGMFGESSSAYVRSNFDVANNLAIEQLLLNVVYDDAFVAYLNGVEVARRNVTGDVEFSSTANSSRTLDEASQVETIDLSSHIDLLTDGENLLAVHGINASVSDDDFALSTRLTARGIVLPDDTKPVISFHEVSSARDETFQVELRNDGETSASINGFIIGTRESETEFAIGDIVLAPGDLVTFSLSDNELRPEDGDHLFLYNADKSSLLDARRVTNRLRGRSPDYDGRWLFPSVATFGEENRFEFTNDVVINEVLYNAYPDRGVPASPPSFETIRLLNDGVAWRYNQNLSNTGLPSGWANTAHSPDDQTWFIGASPLGFTNSPALLPIPLGTQLRDPASNSPRVTTYYFETEFDFDQPAGAFEVFLNPLIDDGAIFYLNGEEIHRYNMPEGAITPTTRATPSVGTATFTGPISVPHDSLVVGSNRLSVEVHQSSTLSTDVIFGARLELVQQVSDSQPGRPFQERDEEWIELFNRGSEPVDLSNWHIDGGVEFDFPVGTMIGAGEYLLVANDETAFSKNYPELGDQVLGEFSGRLSDRSERIRLEDSFGNPADEVQYFDDGHWPAAADGGGSSVELRDPFADNSVAESWAASDESDGSDWQTYRYRGTAVSDGLGNNIFHEFVLGLLDSGTVLLDDLSVIQDPDGAAVELLQNGDFESDSVGALADMWRLNGTHGDHGESMVVVDPDQLGNQVLRLVTSGPTEDKHNQASTTFADGRRLIVGSDYEISFRAKWISGSNQINTRLYFNYLQQTTLIDTPTQWGSPGRVNSQASDNWGPTYSDLEHQPAVPSITEPVQVSVVATDQDGIASMTLWYSVDDGPFTDVAMVARQGRYAGTIPPQSGGALVQFYIEGTDSAGATSMYPADGAQSRAMYQVDDGRAELDGRHNLRIIMTPSDTDFMYTNVNRMSNDRLGATVIYDESEVFYDVGVRLKGSAFGRNNDSVAGLSIRFQPDELFRGVHRTLSIERAGNPKEMVAKHMLNRASGGLISMYDDVAHVITPRSQDTGVALFSMTRTSGVYLDSLYDDADAISVYNLELLYSPQGTLGGDPENPKINFPYTHNNGRPQFEDLGDDKESYRWNFQLRSSRDRDDFQPLMDAAQAFSLSGQQLEDRIDEVIDVDQWMRTFAMLSLNGNDDVYTRLWEHNFRTHTQPDGRLVAVPWDLDRAFQLSTSASPWGITNNAGTRNNVANVIERPIYTRLFWGHVLDIANTTANADYMTSWTTHYGELIGRSFSGELNYIRNRANFLLGRLPPEIEFEFTTNGGADLSTSSRSLVLEGKGWVDVRGVRAVGTDRLLDVEWLDDETWQVTVGLSDGVNDLHWEAINHQGEVVGTDRIQVTNALPNPVPEQFWLSEINYNPAQPTADELALAPDLDNNDFEFLEFVNVGPIAINLANVQITSGVNFTFPDFELLPNDRVVVVQDQDAFELRYGAGVANIVGEFESGRLSNGGESIVVADSAGESFLRVDYDDRDLWHQRADGHGATLELAPVTDSATPIENGVFHRWRGSTNVGGTPGAENSQPVGVEISEVLSRTDPTTGGSDAIELFNATAGTIDLSGWYLSDSVSDLLRFRIPDGTTLGAGEHVVFTESDFNPTPEAPGPDDFALSGVNGDAIWLVDATGTQLRFVDEVHFGATSEGQTLGRTPDSNGRLVPLTRDGIGCGNQHALIGDVYISQIQYLPAEPLAAALAIDATLETNELEYLAIRGEVASGWEIRGGIDFDFPTDFESTGEVWLLPFNPDSPANASKVAAFREHYGLTDDGPELLGGYAGNLSDRGEAIRLLRPDVAPLDDPGNVPTVLVDEAIYDVHGSWPSATAGEAIVRRSSTFFGNQGNHWLHASEAASDELVVGDFNGDGEANVTDLDLLLDAVNRDSLNHGFITSDAIELSEGEVRHYVQSILGTQPGDASLNGIVNAEDLNIVGVNWSQKVCGGWVDGDFTGDNRVDAADLNVLGLNWLAVAESPIRSPRAPLAAALPVDLGPPDIVPSPNTLAAPSSNAGSEHDVVVFVDSDVEDLRLEDLRLEDLRQDWHQRGSHRQVTHRSQVEARRIRADLHHESADHVFAELATLLGER